MEYEEISIKSDQTYTSCYCEENVWKLCDKIQNSKNLRNLVEKGNVYAIFISNENKTVPLWQQSASENEDGLVVWDYHVILAMKGEKCMVFDLDTKLPYPCEFEQYSERTFQSDDDIMEKFHRKFRVITIQEFLEHFASDRRHMKDANGEWIKPSPNYPCIQTSKSCNNIDIFISMDKNVGWGEVLSLKQFIDLFSN